MNKINPPVSFDVSMQPSEAYDQAFAGQDQEWLFLKKLYQDNYLDRLPGKTAQETIPRTIHQIWLGGELPDRFKEYRQSWARLHPAWELRLWGDADVDGLKIRNRTLFDKMPNYGNKSDLLRYEILFQYGGLYVDVDFECLKPFDSLHSGYSFYTGVGYQRHPLLFNGLIGAAPGHPIIGRCLDSVQCQASAPASQNADQIMDTTGPDYFTRCFMRAAPGLKGEKIVALPVTYFYPFPGCRRFERDHEKIRSYIRSESYCLHYWACSWVPQEKTGPIRMVLRKLRCLIKSIGAGRK